MTAGRHRLSPSARAGRYVLFDVAAGIFQTFLLGIAIRRHNVDWIIFNLAFVVFDLWQAYHWNGRRLEALVREGKIDRSHHHHRKDKP